MNRVAPVDVEIRHERYVAAVSTVGASLRSLTHDGRDLVLPFAAGAVRPRFRGAVLAPWPNRVSDGCWTWAGEQHQLAISEPERSAALHGLVVWTQWAVAARSDAAVRLTTSVAPQPGYPVALELAVEYTLAYDGLGISLHARNSGTVPAPYGCGIHPYLVAPGGTVDDWTFTLPAARRLEVDALLRPVGDPVAPPSDADFRTPRRLGAARVDHAYTDVSFTDGVATAVLAGRDGAAVGLHFGAGTPWVQVCTSDFPEPDAHRAGLAVEPMTCPPDAFNSGVDLVMLAGAQTHEARWRIEAC